MGFGKKATSETKDTKDTKDATLPIKNPPPTRNVFSEDYLKRKPPAPPALVQGGLSSSSIFESTESAPSRQHALAQSPALDPDPNARKRWERKMVIRQIQRRGRLSKTMQIKRTERESLSKSHMLKTSVKKLGPLARQIAGKSVEDAIVQMRFSRKKVAKDVKEHLEHARNEAIVRRGMGLGEAEGTKGKEVEIQLKNGKRRLVKDRTGLYVDQAWVGRGTFGRTPDFRARGRVNVMRPPHTSISVLLKEEATRVRISQEMDEKRRKKKLWVHLPNRPVTAQRPYYSW
ncbi:MAG: 54S ribosomal protein L22, mitochondrial [Candelina submexicana]|nr:MAG: 54S ribosomal protein L22, mitochondrial [Candelina submexicana]